MGQPLAQPPALRVVEHDVVATHVKEPVVERVVVERLAEGPMGAHRVQDDQQLTLEQPLWPDRGRAEGAVWCFEIPADAYQSRAGIIRDRAQGMFGRSPARRRLLRGQYAWGSVHRAALPL